MPVFTVSGTGACGDAELVKKKIKISELIINFFNIEFLEMVWQTWPANVVPVNEHKYNRTQITQVIRIKYKDLFCLFRISLIHFKQVLYKHFIIVFPCETLLQNLCQLGHRNHLSVRKNKSLRDTLSLLCT